MSEEFGDVSFDDHLGTVGAAMVFAGWLRFQRTSTEATLTVETSKIEQDSEQLIRRGQEVIREAANELSSPEGTRRRPQPERDPLPAP